MKLADVSVRRPVFAAHDDRGAHRARLVLVPRARPRPDAEDRLPRRHREHEPARRERRGDRDADHQADRGGRQHDQRHRRAAGQLGPGQLARHHHVQRSSGTSRPPTQDVRDKVGDDRQPLPAGHAAARHPEDRSRRRADPHRRRLGPRGRRRSSPRSPTSGSSRCSRRCKDVGAVTFIGERQREIQLLLNADRLNAYGLTVDQVRHGGAAAERRGARRELHRRADRDRPAHDGPHPERRGLQPDHHRLPRAGRSSRFGDVGRVMDTRPGDPRASPASTATPAISLLIRKQSGTNTVDVVDGVLARLERIQRDAAAGHPASSRSAISRASSAGRSRTSSCTCSSAACSPACVVFLFIRNLRVTLIAGAGDSRPRSSAPSRS